MNKKIVQKLSKNKYVSINNQLLKSKYLKPISSREKKFIKERLQVEAIFDIYTNLVLRILNGTIFIRDELMYLFGQKPSTFNNILTTIIGGFCGYNSILETRERINSGDDVKFLQRGKYVLRDKDFMEKNYYYLFLEQLSCIINMSKTSNYYGYFREKSLELSGKYGLGFWFVLSSMIGLANIWYAVESSNQEVKNMFIEGTDIVNEPYLVIGVEKKSKKK